MERHNDCRSAGNDKEREKPEMDTQQSFVVALANNGSNPRSSLPSFPLCCRFPVYVGLIEAFRHRNVSKWECISEEQT